MSYSEQWDIILNYREMGSITKDLDRNAAALNAAADRLGRVQLNSGMGSFQFAAGALFAGGKGKIGNIFKGLFSSQRGQFRRLATPRTQVSTRDSFEGVYSSRRLRRIVNAREREGNIVAQTGRGRRDDIAADRGGQFTESPRDRELVRPGGGSLGIRLGDPVRVVTSEGNVTRLTFGRATFRDVTSDLKLRVSEAQKKLDKMKEMMDDIKTSTKRKELGG